MADERGIKELLDVLNAAKELLVSAKKARKSGGSILAIGKEFIDDFDDVVAAIQGIENVPAEVADLSDEETHQIVDAVLAIRNAVKEA